jgi:hypothetical protein
MNNQIKNPLVDLVDEDISRMPMQLSFFEKIGLTSIMIIFIFILTFAGFSLFADILKFDFLSILIDIFFIIMCIAAIYFSFNILKKKIVTEALIDTAFQHGVYTRLQSLIENIATSQIGTDIIMNRISDIDTKVESILKERRPDVQRVDTDIMQEHVALGTSLKFMIKTIFMIVLTMAIFMFLVNFALGTVTPYVTLFIFVMWWLFITNEYSLWKETGAWTFVFFPIVMVPVGVIIISNFVEYNVMMALLYLFVGIYSLLYYIWAIYTTTRSLPFITPKREKSEDISEFFASQQKGMFREILEDVRRIIKYERED